MVSALPRQRLSAEEAPATRRHRQARARSPRHPLSWRTQDDRERYAAVETAALKAVQEIHWSIHRAFTEYQRVAEDRRQLAADIGELVAKLVDALAATGWTETEAREVNIDELAGRQSSGRMRSRDSGGQLRTTRREADRRGDKTSDLQEVSIMPVIKR